jgi:hypothetical protein
MAERPGRARCLARTSAGLPFGLGDFSSRKRGTYTFLARATNRIGQTQTEELIFNPSGYHHNVVQSVTVHVA